MLDKANRILALFTPERPELTVVEIAESLKRPRSTVYRIVGSMAEAGFLDQDPITGRLRVGMYLAKLGELARQSTSLQRATHPIMLRLSETTGELTSLMVPSGGEGVTVDVIESFHPVKIPGHLGGRFPLHATAGGKALLAWRSPDEIAKALEAPLPRLAPRTITSVPRVMKELEQTRRQGYGVSLGEWVEDVFAVAAPVRDHRGRVVAAVGCASPESRWQPRHVKAITKAVLAAATECTSALGGWTPGESRVRPAARRATTR